VVDAEHLERHDIPHTLDPGTHQLKMKKQARKNRMKIVTGLDTFAQRMSGDV